MSADNYATIKPKGDKYVLSVGCASNDYIKELEFSTLEEAVNAAPDTEYGLRITTNSKALQGGK